MSICTDLLTAWTRAFTGRSNWRILPEALRSEQHHHHPRAGRKYFPLQMAPAAVQASWSCSETLQELSELLAVNCHQIWARRKKFDLENMGAALHDQLVPYDLLTDLEKEKDLRFSNELIKFLQLNGYRMQRYLGRRACQVQISIRSS